MTLWRQLARGLRVLTNRAAADRDVADEVQHYFDEAVDAGIARGLSPEEARRAAGAQFGSLTAVREQVRTSGWEHVLQTVVADARYGLRRLHAAPGFSVVSILTLALGIGAATAIFSAINPILFEPLPYPAADRLVTIWDRGTNGSRVGMTFGSYRELAARSRSFDAMAVMKSWQPTLTGSAQPERLDGQRISAAYFRVLGAAPAVGRDFEPPEDQRGGPDVAIISNALWRRRFGADAGIVGTQITLDARPYLIVGVLPSSFENVLAPSAEIWAPLQYDASLPLQGREWGHHLRMAARLGAGVSADRAGRELDAIAELRLPQFPRAPWASMPQGLILTSLQGDVVRGVRPALLAVFGAVVVVLLIASVNVTNLLLARGAQRRAEFAMRAALGASRPRMIRQLLIESLVLAGIGGAAGLALARVGLRAVVALAPPELPRAAAIAIDSTAFAFAAGLTTVIGIAVGLIPAFDASRGDLHSGLHDSSQRVAGRRRHTRRVLVVAEVALAIVLLVGAGLLWRSLHRLFSIEPGFDQTHLLTMQVQTSGRRYTDADARHRFFADALEAVRGVPGVADAGWTSQLPLSGTDDMYGVHLDPAIVAGSDADGAAFRYAVTPGYFETMRIPLRRGRLFDGRDTTGTPLVAVISESLAKGRFRSVEPLGQRLSIGPADAPLRTVVGVVADVRQQSLAAAVADAVYVPTRQWPYPDGALWLVVRARGDAAALAASVGRAVWSADKDQPIVRVATMDDLVKASAAERRFALMAIEAFALAALVLAALGLYGVLAGSVTERTREIGVRAALGASRGNILALVVRQGMAMTGLGLAIGLAAATFATKALMTLLFSISPLDPMTYGAVVVLLLGVATVACWVPAWRAVRVDPSIALRAE